MTTAAAKEIVNTFSNQSPVRVIPWKDEITSAKGWLVINTIGLGVAGGGIRMRKDLGEQEVVDLAKAMSLKFSLLNPIIGGAKSGIDYDPKAKDKHEVLITFLEFIKIKLIN